MSSRLKPSEEFPEDLAALELPDVEILNSKIHRELDYEYAHDGEACMETEIRHEEVTEELDHREQQPESAPLHPEFGEPARQCS